jgi:tellurite methyltransferase
MAMQYLILSFLFTSLVWAKSPISAERLNQLSGEKQNNFDTKSEWDMRYSRPSFVFGKTPAKFLAENFHYIKDNSKVLDLGMGEGRNAVFLAQKGHQVTGIDISSVAIKKANLLAQEFGVRIKGVVASMDEYVIPKDSYDAIICFYYVDRKLIEKIKNWLKPGGILIYEAYSLKQRTLKDHRPDPEAYYLKEQELLTMFKGMRILKYEEPLHEKQYRASIILQK